MITAYPANNLIIFMIADRKSKNFSLASQNIKRKPRKKIVKTLKSLAMNTRFLLAIFSLAALSSCSTAYKAQTPDDVYYSPAKPQAEYVKTETPKDREAYRYESSNDYYSPDDRWLRWKVRDRQRWSTFDDYDYQFNGYNEVWSYNTYNAYSYNRPWGNYWNSYWTWNSYYNPYCNKVIVVNPKTNATVYNKIRTYTPGTYNNTTYNNRNVTRPVKLSAGSYSPNNSYNNGNSNSLGNSIRKIFSNSNNNSSSTPSSNDRPVRTYTPPSNSSSSSPSSSGSSGSSGGSSGGGGSRPTPGG